MTAQTSRVQQSTEHALREWNKILGLWSVCGKAACVRAHACRGNVRACAPKNFAGLPDEVQGWFCKLLIAQEDGLSFDEAIARIDKTPLNEAFCAWHESLPDAEKRGWQVAK